MNVSEFIQANRADPAEGVAHGQVLARYAAAGDEEPVSLAEQAEENAVRMLAAGYQPGSVTARAGEIADVEAALETERRKVEAGRRYMADVMRAFEQGRIGAMDVARAGDGDRGDPGLVERLERRLEALRREQSSAVRSLPDPAGAGGEDPLQRAAAAAHEAFVAATRAQMTAARAGTLRASRPRERRPFAAVRGAGPDCAECVAAGATPEESAAIHAGDFAFRGEAGWWDAPEITRATDGVFAGAS